MTIIDTIIAHKKTEIATLDDYTQKPLTKNNRCFYTALKKQNHDGINIIAEVKKASPTAGTIKNVVPSEQALLYQKSGASAVSCLTDTKFFNGSCNDLQAIAHTIKIPVIRKDFIFDINQIAQARFFGASSYLLMVEVIEKTNTNLVELIEYGRSLGMEPLVETYDEQSIKKALNAGAKIIGVNSRNFQKEGLPIELNRFAKLLPLLPNDVVRVAESGLSNKADIDQVSSLADAVLIGTALMQKTELEIKAFISSLQ